MLHSNKFQETTITLNNKEFRIEYDLTVANEHSLTCFGNIYKSDDDDEPIEFTYFTINGKIAGYTPMNGTKEFISNIVSTTSGQNLHFEN